MMRKLLITFSLMSLLNPLIGYEIPNKEKPMKGLKSKIEIEYKYDEKFGEFLEIQKNKIITRYDTSGYLKEKQEFSSYKEFIKKYVYEYDQMGNEIVYQEIYGSGEMSVDQTLSNEYNSKGYLIQTTDHNSQSNESIRRIYNYDPKGNMIEKSYYKVDTDKLNKKEVYIFDSKGQLIEEALYAPGGSTIKKTKHIYDSSGNRIESLSFNSKGKETSKIVYTYRRGGKLERMDKIWLDGNLKNQSVTSKFDLGGNKIEGVGLTSKGLVDYRFTYKYDSNDNVIEVRRHDPDRFLSSYQTYQYDIHGRIIEYNFWVYKEMFEEIKEFPVEKTTYEYELY